MLCPLTIKANWQSAFRRAMGERKIKFAYELGMMHNV